MVDHRTAALPSGASLDQARPPADGFDPTCIATEGVAPIVSRHTSTVRLRFPESFAEFRGAVSNLLAVIRARWYLRSATRLSPTVRLWGHPLVTNSGTMVFGDRVRLVSTAAKLELAAVGGGQLLIGEQTYINYGCSIAANSLIRIGARCNIGTHVLIMDCDYHHVEVERRNERPAPVPVLIEDDVWIGARVIILKGVTIGAGSVVGAGSIVTRDIPPRSVAVGQPARVVRSL